VHWVRSALVSTAAALTASQLYAISVIQFMHLRCQLLHVYQIRLFLGRRT